jgi:hypothetical protein
MMERYSTTALYTNLKIYICLLYTYRERFENILCGNDNSDGCIDVAIIDVIDQISTFLTSCVLV